VLENLDEESLARKVTIKSSNDNQLLLEGGDIELED
jgi:hypothetical protein